MTRLHASFFKLFAFVCGVMLLVTLAAALMGKASFDSTLAIPMTIAPLFLWFGFVPRLMEYSPEALHLKSWLGGDETLSWSRLKYFGGGTNRFFCLQFEDRRSLQICSYAYDAQQWADFKSFLEANFADRKPDIWFGSRGYRLPWHR